MQEVTKTYRITIVNPSAGVNWSGGGEIFAIELARHLNSYFDVELLSGATCTDFCYPAGGIPRVDAYNLVRHPLLAPLFHRFATHPEIVIEHLSNFLPCAIHCLTHPTDLIFPCNDYGGLAMAAVVRAIKGTPILFTEHVGLVGKGVSLGRNLRFQPDRLVVFSEEMALFARNLRPSQVTSVIPNGVDVNKFTPNGDRIDLNLPKPVVLCVASLKRNSHKRIELAMQAVARLPQASLLLCGDGLDRDYFQSLGEKLLGTERFVIKSVPHQQMPSVYRSADAFTLPSINEPFGLAYLEAMACGLPVVATDDQMRRYIVGNGGVVCDVNNPDSYATALSTVLQGDWQARAREHALGFSWDAIARRYRNVIIKTITQSGRGRGVLSKGVEEKPNPI
ncbi:MAG: glycosyltransferase [Calothrix sp. MO_167.B12]|nr:glycosyltransferase [Calothrix sp. MO_167.B12]